MYLLNNNRKWTEDTKGELNVPMQNSIFSHISKIKGYYKEDYYAIKTRNRLFSSTVSNVCFTVNTSRIIFIAGFHVTS